MKSYILSYIYGLKIYYWDYVALDLPIVLYCIDISINISINILIFCYEYRFCQIQQKTPFPPQSLSKAMINPNN